MSRLLGLLSACVLVFASACTAGHSGAAPSGSPRGSRTTDAAAAAPVAARMSSGTDSEAGVLASWCPGERCRPKARGRPRRSLKGDDAGFVYFAISARPSRARVEVRRGARLVASGSLRRGTTMAFALRLPAGHYQVVLDAVTPNGEGRWAFGLIGPVGK